MLVYSRTVGPFMENSYVLACPETRKAAIIDPGEAGPVLEVVSSEGLEPLFILNTHAHIDHVIGVAEIQQRLGIPFHLHPAEHEWAANIPVQAAMFGLPAPEAPRVDGEIKGGDVWEIGTLRADVVDVPGHSPGHVALILPDRVFSGDCLFAGSIGRTDLPGGNYEQLIESIRSKLLTLPDETIVHSGHGPDTTIGREKASNPFLT